MSLPYLQILYIIIQGKINLINVHCTIPENFKRFDKLNNWQIKIITITEKCKHLSANDKNKNAALRNYSRLLVRWDYLF